MAEDCRPGPAAALATQTRSLLHLLLAPNLRDGKEQDFSPFLLDIFRSLRRHQVDNASIPTFGSPAAATFALRKGQNMPIRQPKIKDQAALLRKHLAAKGLVLAQGESLELAATLNGFPSWNVAKSSNDKLEQPAEGVLPVQVWHAVHTHRHGGDVFLFAHNPDEAEVIEKINAVSSFEPDAGEYIEICGPEVLHASIAQTMQRPAAAPSTAMVQVYEVDMTTLLDYEDPTDVPQWTWVQSLSAFSHVGNGSSPGTWEFMVHEARLNEALEERSVPKELRNEVQKAMDLGATWVMFHQG